MYADNADGNVKTNKALFAAVTMSYTLIISIPTFYYLVHWKEILRLAFLLDTIMAVTVVAALSFISLMSIFDNDNDWQFNVI